MRLLASMRGSWISGSRAHAASPSRTLNPLRRCSCRSGNLKRAGVRRASSCTRASAGCRRRISAAKSKRPPARTRPARPAFSAPAAPPRAPPSARGSSVRAGGRGGCAGRHPPRSGRSDSETPPTSAHRRRRPRRARGRAWRASASGPDQARGHSVEPARERAFPHLDRRGCPPLRESCRAREAPGGHEAPVVEDGSCTSPSCSGPERDGQRSGRSRCGPHPQWPSSPGQRHPPASRRARGGAAMSVTTRRSCRRARP